MSYPPPGTPPPPPGGYGYGQPGYPQPGYVAPVVVQNNGLATGALVTGLIALLCFPALGLVSIPLGVMGLKRAGVLHGKGKGMAIAGIITGIIGILWGIAFLALVVFAAENADEIDNAFDCGIEEARVEAAVSSYRAAEGTEPTSEEELVSSGYLSSTSDDFDLDTSGGTTTVVDAPGSSC